MASTISQMVTLVSCTLLPAKKETELDFLNEVSDHMTLDGRYTTKTKYRFESKFQSVMSCFCSGAGVPPAK